MNGSYSPCLLIGHFLLVVKYIMKSFLTFSLDFIDLFHCFYYLHLINFLYLFIFIITEEFLSFDCIHHLKSIDVYQAISLMS